MAAKANWAQLTANFVPGANPTDLAEKVIAFDPKFRTAANGVVLYHEPVATAHMKEKAPWTDRTGNARAGLHTTHEITDEYAQLTMAHSVYYGIFLEVCNSGKYAIIAPTVEYIGKLILERLDHLFARMEAEK